ncbi:MAG: NUDIX domain-containing protein [Granulosicoccus sp.]
MSVLSKPARRRWTLESRETVYQRLYQIDSVSFQHDLHGGGSSGIVHRELFVRGNVVGVVPYDPVTDRVVLLEQFRIGAMYQTPDPWMLEIVAGMIDTDETPEQVAIREAHEEAGLQLADIQLVMQYLASPGASTEEVFIYYAETDLSDVGGYHGLADEDEDIRVMVVSAQEAFELVDKRVIKNAVSLLGLQWLRLKRAGLISS